MMGSSDSISLGLYIPSYKRANAVDTLRYAPDAVVVVRESEEPAYLESNPDARVIGVEDRLIDSATKVRNWILGNAEEDVVVQLDDDITCVKYSNQTPCPVLSPEEFADEIARIAVVLDDLKLGYAGINGSFSPARHGDGFSFTSLCGVVTWYDRKYLKARYDERCILNDDLDFALQELAANRIYLCVDYMLVIAGRDTNAGGNTDLKSRNIRAAAIEYMKQKWGDAFVASPDSKSIRFNVKR